MQTDKKNCFCFGRQKSGNIRFYKIFILGNSPCLRRFFYGTAEASEISGSIDCYLGGSREGEGGNESLGGFSIYPGMGRCGPAPDLTKTFE